MAKMVPVGGFLLSGRIDNVVFVRRGRGAYVRRWVRARDPRTERQLAQRERFRWAAAAWNGLSEQKKAQYRDRAQFSHRTGFQLFVSEYLCRMQCPNDASEFREGDTKPPAPTGDRARGAP